MLKQTSYFKRQLLLCLFEFGSLGEWRGGKVRKVDSVPMNKEGQKKCKSKTVHLPECHSCSQRYHFKIHLWSDTLRFREPSALQHLNSVTPVSMSSLSACTFMVPSRMVLWCARCSLLGHAHPGIQLCATTTGQRAAPDSHCHSSAGFIVASCFLLCSALWFSATVNFCLLQHLHKHLYSCGNVAVCLHCPFSSQDQKTQNVLVLLMKDCLHCHR